MARRDADTLAELSAKLATIESQQQQILDALAKIGCGLCRSVAVNRELHAAFQEWASEYRADVDDADWWRDGGEPPG